MAQSYTQIQRKIEALQRQAEKIRSSEIHGVVQRIKTAIAHYGLTADQLGFGNRPSARASLSSASAGPRAGKAAKGKGGAKFSDGNGNVWSGRGPRPHWLRDALSAGRKLEEFATGAVSTTKAAKKTGKRPSSVMYRDDAGHAWSGRGPKPGWLKDAIAGGKTLEELKA